MYVSVDVLILLSTFYRRKQMQKGLAGLTFIKSLHFIFTEDGGDSSPILIPHLCCGSSVEVNLSGVASLSMSPRD